MTTRIESFIESTQHRMDLPQQYFGDEPNSYRKSWDEATVRMLTFACWPYEQAAGNQAIPLVYKTINEHERYLADRWYFPATPRDMRLLESADIPMFGIEQRRPARDFDVVGTSISYPVLAINFMKQLAMSGIPPTRETRWTPEGDRPGREAAPEKWPMVIVGGQAFGAPEVLAAIADVVFCGEAEDEPGNPGLVAVFRTIEELKEAGWWDTRREDCYAELAREFSFLYFPRFIDVQYGYEQREQVDRVLGEKSEPSKQVTGYVSNLPGMRLPIVKRFVRDLDQVEPLDNPPLLYVDPGMGAGDLEVGRGCPAWCSFCALTYRQKPYRQRSVDYMEAFAQRLKRNTGAIHLSPFSPDFPMHTQKKALLERLLGVVDDINASSMRVDDFIADPSYILLQAHAGMDSVTLGVEGNSQRMRDLVGKGAADEDIMEAVALGIKAGIRKFKLYMISALPGEDEGDIYRLLNLAVKLADIRDSMGAKALIQFSWTPLLIEGNTPLQWFGPTQDNYALGDVWDRLRDLGIDFKLGGKSQRDRRAFQQLSQRASREVGKAIADAAASFNDGSWGGVSRGLYDRMVERLKASGFHNGIADVYDERDKVDMFGWEFIDQGINVELMWKAFMQMREFLENTDSETYDLQFGEAYRGNEWIERCDTRCMGKTCGVCSPEDLKIRRGYIQAALRESTVDLTTAKVIDQRTVANKIRAKVYKAPEKRLVMNDHWRYRVRAAAFRAEMPIASRTIRFTSDAIKFKDWTCGVDYMEFGVTTPMSSKQAAELLGKMNAELGRDFQITDWQVYPGDLSPLRTDVDLSLYEMEVDVSPDKALAAVRRWRSSEEVLMVLKEDRQMGMVRREVNAKDYVEDLWFVRQGFRLMLRMLVRGRASPYDVYAALMEKRSWIEAARYPAIRVAAFLEADADQYDFFRSACAECGRVVPVDVLDREFDVGLDEPHCPKCGDASRGFVVDERVSA